MARVLYVEDNEDMAEIVGDCLKGFGYEVIHFFWLNDAKIAFSKDKTLFDFVVSDGNLQTEKDGFKWARELHKDGIKVLIISLDVSLEDVSDMLFIDKLYFNPTALKEAIEKLLNS